MQVKCRISLLFEIFKFFSKTLAFSPDIVYYKRVRFVGQEAKTSPLTAKTGFDSPYELLKVRRMPSLLKILF